MMTCYGPFLPKSPLIAGGSRALVDAWAMGWGIGTHASDMGVEFAANERIAANE